MQSTKTQSNENGATIQRQFGKELPATLLLFLIANLLLSAFISITTPEKNALLSDWAIRISNNIRIPTDLISQHPPAQGQIYILSSWMLGVWWWIIHPKRWRVITRGTIISPVSVGRRIQAIFGIFFMTIGSASAYFFGFDTNIQYKRLAGAVTSLALGSQTGSIILNSCLLSVFFISLACLPPSLRNFKIRNKNELH